MKDLLFKSAEDDLGQVRDRYQQRVPAPLNSQFAEKLSKTDAIKKREQARQQTTTLYPPRKFSYFIKQRGEFRFLQHCLNSCFVSGEEQEQQLIQSTSTPAASATGTTRRSRHCKKCKRPMKGHPRSHCP